MVSTVTLQSPTVQRVASAFQHYHSLRIPPNILNHSFRWVDWLNLLLVSLHLKETMAVLTDAPGARFLDELAQTTGLACHSCFDRHHWVFLSSRAERVQQLTDILDSSAGFSALSPSDHWAIGVFLDVPECCLQPAAILPVDANSHFSQICKAPSALDLHFCSHLPCSSTCQASQALGQKNSQAIRQIDPTLWHEIYEHRHQVPLLLY